jgi:hypothetical protein
MRHAAILIVATLLTPAAAPATSIECVERELQERQLRANEAARAAKVAQDRAVQEGLRRRGYIFHNRKPLKEQLEELRRLLPPDDL